MLDIARMRGFRDARLFENALYFYNRSIEISGFFMEISNWIAMCFPRFCQGCSSISENLFRRIVYHRKSCIDENQIVVLAWSKPTAFSPLFALGAISSAAFLFKKTFISLFLLHQKTCPRKNGRLRFWQRKQGWRMHLKQAIQWVGVLKFNVNALILFA